jgi:hypothetical protein
MGVNDTTGLRLVNDDVMAEVLGAVFTSPSKKAAHPLLKLLVGDGVLGGQGVKGRLALLLLG